MSTRGARANNASGPSSTIAQKAALASAYQELGRELSSGRLKTVGNYTLGRPIGEGTYGKVRMATHRLTGQRVAIKQVPRSHQHISSLTREIHHHRRLHHPNVMQLYEVIATEAHIWMAVELCAGGELYDYLVERGVLPETETRRIFGQLCLALAYVHARGIVHRDLKLENVLLDERCNVKLGDFGFTREFEKNQLMDTFCGTTGYAAPEMLAGKKYTGEQVDIWSLGIILYALLCGALPFDDDDDDVMKAKILVGEFEIPEELSEEAQDLLRTILRHNPVERPTIRAILSHPWFKKDFALNSMSTVDEAESLPSSMLVEGERPEGTADDDAVLDKTGSNAGPKPKLSTLDVGSREGKGSDEPTTASSGSDSYTTPLSTPGLKEFLSSTSASAPASEKDAITRSVNDVSSASFSSGVSDSESSDQRSSTTDVTNPTTEESSSTASDSATDVTSAKESTQNGDDSTTDAVDLNCQIGLHRNESQTTIRRDGSVSSTASKRASTGPIGKANGAATLATHHESVSSSEVDSLSPASPEAPTLSLTEAKADEEGSTLNKRNSQGSSKGHHRTPSRTKRRSLSSSGLSIHETPHAHTKPLDYVSLLAHLQPDLFSTTLEQRLLSQMSTLGLDVGQIVHSILNDACDTTGATWWLLKRKAEERATFAPREASLPATPLLERTELDLEQQYAVAYAAGRASAMTINAGPAKERERGRPSEGLPPPSSYTYVGPTQNSDGLPKTAVDSFRRRVDPASLGLQGASSAAESSLMSKLIEVQRAADSNKAGTSTSTAAGSSRATPERRQSGRSSEDTPSETRRPSIPSSDKGDPPKRKEPTRTRTNSFSMRQLTSALVGSSGSASPSKSQGDKTDATGAEADRAKSPVSALFGKRSGGSVLKGPARSREASPLTSVDEKGRSGSPKLQHAASGGTLRAPVAVQGMPSSPLRTSAAVSGDSSSSARGGAPATIDTPKTPLISSESVEAFSDVVSESDGDLQATPLKSRTKSSFLSTVRTWLGTDEKQARKRGKKGKGAGKGKLPASSLGHDGPGSASQMHARQGSTRSRASPYGHAGSVSRRGSNIAPLSPGRQGGFSSRRGSNSSVQLLTMMDGSGHLARPPNIRRQSAGSITPTTTMYGDGEFGLGGLAAFNPRTSRPGSSNSLYRAVRPGSLHAKSGSASSSSSIFRVQQAAGSSQSAGYAGSLRGMHARRPSDGGATVRRHRQYPSAGRRASSIASRNSSPGPPLLDDEGESAVEALQVDGTASPRAASTGAHSARPSLDSQPGTPRASAHPHSIFIAHKSRSPYKPPSANPGLLHQSHSSHSISSALARAASRSPKARTVELASQTTSADSTLGVAAGVSAGRTTNSGPAVPTWRRSWGRPPPAWTGAVDDQPSTDELVAAARPKLRDVFAGKDDDEWVDEGDEQEYSGGLGQVSVGSSALLSLSDAMGSGARGSGFTRGGDMGDSPFASRTMSSMQGFGMGAGGSGSYTRYGSGGAGSGGLLASGRYAGVRTLFQPPSLGRDTAPRTLAVSPAVADGADVMSPIGPTSNPTLDPVPETGAAKEGEKSGEQSAANGAPSAAGAVGTQRSRAQPPAFKNMPIEEEEEDE